jgi:hypothetical protein
MGLREGDRGGASMNAKRVRHALAWTLGAVGLLQMAGDVLNNRVLRGLGAATAVAPFPKVFCDLNGMEPFASTFTLLAETEDGRTTELEITPEVYAKLGGPYNLRNAYGAALSYAPRLPEALWQAVADHGLREDGPLQRELELPENVKRWGIVIATRTRGRNDVWRLDLP